MPKDSPRSDGAQNTSAAVRRAFFSSSLTRPSHSTRGSPVTRACRALVSGPSPAIHNRTSAGSSGRRAQEHIQPLAGLVAAEEEHRRPRLGGRRRRRDALDLDAVEHDVVVTAERVVRHRPRVMAHRAAHVEPLDEPTHARPKPLVREGPARRVERPDERLCLDEHRRSRSVRARGARGGAPRRTTRRAGPGSCGSAPGCRGRSAPSTRWRASAGCCRAASPRRRGAARRRARAPGSRGPSDATPGPARGSGPAPRPAA